MVQLHTHGPTLTEGPQWTSAAPALIDASGTTAYKDLACALEIVAGKLGTYGIHPGARLAGSSPWSKRLLLGMLGCWRAGAWFMPLNPAFPREQVADFVRRFRMDHVHYEDSLRWHGVGCPSTPLSALKFSRDDPRGENRMAEGRLLILTSGSTGTPKAAVLTLANVLANARASNRNIELGPDDRWLLSLPLYHVAGIGAVFRCLLAGATIAIPDPQEDIAGAIEAYGVTHVSLVSTQLYRLMKNTRSRRALSKLKAVLLGGSAFPQELLQDAFGAGIPVHTSYGMTETASQVTCTPPGASLGQLTSSGRPLTDQTVSVTPDGEIRVRGPMVFEGYWDGEEVKRPEDSGGWFRTGDLGHFDCDGCLHVTGRRDNLFISGGENFQPEEIESALLTIPGIVQAVVAPVSDAEFGQRPVAFLRMANRAIPEKKTLDDALSGLLPKFKLPAAYLPWPADLEEGMKIQRSVFRERAEQHYPK